MKMKKFKYEIIAANPTEKTLTIMVPRTPYALYEFERLARRKLGDNILFNHDLKMILIKTT